MTKTLQVLPAVPSEGERIAVCVCTFRRPEGLRALLTSLARQRGLDGRARVEIVVVDNDVDGSAETVVRWAEENLNLCIRYAIESQVGLSFARNRSVAEAHDADLIAFVDDDMTVSGQWLSELLAVLTETGADATGGPVYPRFDCHSARAIKNCGHFDPPVHRRGCELHILATNNALVRAGALRTTPGPFDPRFAEVGGEDTHLFLRLYLSGLRLTWAPRAQAYEHVPRKRTSIRWLLRRRFRHGSSWAIVEQQLIPRVRIRRALRATGHVARGACTLLGGVAMLSPAVQVRGGLEAAGGVGMIAGLFGWTLSEYRKVEGRESIGFVRVR